MYFKITMIWFMLNIFLMISAISQVRGLNKNSSKISNGFYKTKNEPSVLILKDGQGNTYKYIYPNDMDQFSKMSTLGNKNSSTVLHLPPGILKSENTSSCDTSDSTVDQPYIMTTTGRPRITNPKNATNDIKKSSPGSRHSPIVSITLPEHTIEEQLEEENTAISINENESTESTTIKDNNTEKEENCNGGDEKTVIKPIYNNNFSKEISNKYPTLTRSNQKYNESFDKQQNLYKSCDNRNGLILLVENDIKLKLFLNSNGILSLVNSRKNSTIKSKDEFSSEDGVIEN